MSCSNHGFCNASTGFKCECEYGWTSVGDIRYETGLNCDVYVLAIVGLYSTIVIMFIAPLLMEMRIIYKLYSSKVKLLKSVILLHIFLLGSMICYFLVALLRSIYPTTRAICLDYVTTFIFLFANLSLYAFGVVYLDRFFRVSLKQAYFREANLYSKTLSVLRPVTAIALVLSYTGLCALSFAIFSPEHGDFIFVIGQCLVAVAYFTFIFLVPFAINPILIELKIIMDRSDNHLANPLASKLIEHSYNQFILTKTQLIQQTLFNFFITMLNITWPAFRQKLAYIIPISIFFLPFLFFIVIKGFSLRSNAKTSSSKSPSNSKNQLVPNNPDQDDGA